VCRTSTPALDACGEGHRVACHRWRELATATYQPPDEGPLPPTLARLVAAYETDA
jgi:hypothetical protein